MYHITINFIHKKNNKTHGPSPGLVKENQPVNGASALAGPEQTSNLHGPGLGITIPRLISNPGMSVLLRFDPGITKIRISVILPIFTIAKYLLT